MISSKQKLLRQFSDVVSLYVAYLGQDLRVQRAFIRGGECEANNLDHKCDIEIKAKRALSPAEYGLFLRMAEDGKQDLIPETIKWKLGEAWTQGGLGTDGVYSRLFFLAKRASDRSTMQQMDEQFPDGHTLAELSADQIDSVFADAGASIDYLGGA